MAFRRHSCPTVALLVLGCFAVLANSAPRLKSERLKVGCHVEGQRLRQMRHKVHVLSKDAAKHDEDTHTRLVGKDLFRGLEESGPCYVLREVIDFYLATVLKPDQWLAQFSHLKEVKEFLAVLTKKHMADCDTEEKTNANKNIEQLKQKVGEVLDRNIMAIGHIQMKGIKMYLEICQRHQSPNLEKNRSQKKNGSDSSCWARRVRPRWSGSCSSSFRRLGAAAQHPEENQGTEVSHLWPEM
ncbi:interleukin-22-like isoform X3 [Narcine bancroftii]|uniref:interleukin-22-like isoform X3 n=1 Tax=Narcine bancroftii TaxID=1343680 RepID=UPI0038310B78